MTIRGRSAVQVAAASVVLAAAVATAVVLWPTPAAPTHEQISEQIKASAQAQLDASVEAGRYARANLRATAKTPDDESCRAAWDNLLDSERKGLQYGTWLQACAEPATP
ncbi:hypothetical protein OH809_25305 [Streptomyces sp. NBC_00873]|uniref:hypothetical protein n=1 Tax=Streptomyces sp. NBC_00873 TaxID=2975852 RepID=UPI003868FE3D|nr:hypothetical protein OH809_25305 [Streptomyces sp. NBC_00873]